MSATFLYDSVVTGEDLDNISVDLGVDSEVFTNYESNSTLIAISDLNNITKDLASKGVLQIGGKLEVVTNPETKKFSIKDGVCVFSDGCKYRRNTDYATRTYPYNTTTSTYVYVKRNSTANTVVLYYGSVKPTTGDLVMLAEITSEGVVNDIREWSISQTSRRTVKPTFIACEPISNEWSYVECNNVDYTMVSLYLEASRTVYTTAPGFYELDDLNEHEVSIRRAGSNSSYTIVLQKEGSKLKYKLTFSNSCSYLKGFYIF
ncbi:MAG: hypothetical protein IJ460_04535 [Clostridia bacterium]|nr:hypothetical protein [Clostridia bacterium]